MSFIPGSAFKILFAAGVVTVEIPTKNVQHPLPEEVHLEVLQAGFDGTCTPVDLDRALWGGDPPFLTIGLSWGRAGLWPPLKGGGKDRRGL